MTKEKIVLLVNGTHLLDTERDQGWKPCHVSIYEWAKSEGDLVEAIYFQSYVGYPRIEKYWYMMKKQYEAVGYKTPHGGMKIGGIQPSALITEEFDTLLFVGVEGEYDAQSEKLRSKGKKVRFISLSEDNRECFEVHD